MKLRTLIPLILFIYAIGVASFASLQWVRNTRVRVLGSHKDLLLFEIGSLQQAISEWVSEGKLDRVSKWIMLGGGNPDIKSLLLVDRNHRILFSSHPEWIGHDVEALTAYNGARADQASASGQRIIDLIDSGAKGINEFVGYFPTRLENGTGTLFVEYDNKKKLDRAIRDARVAALELLALLAGFALLCYWGLNRLVTRRIDGLSRVMEKVAAGDLSARSGVTGLTEVGNLGAAFDRTLHLLEVDRLALAKREAEFGAIFRAMDDMLMMMAPDRRILLVNPAVTSLLGYEAKEVVGKTTEFIYANRADFLEVGRLTALGQNPKRMEVDFRKKDGAAVPVEITSVPVHGSENQVVGLLAITRDISDRKRLESTLEEKVKFEALVAETSARLIALPISEIEAEVKKILTDIGQNSDLMFTISLLSEEENRLVLLGTSGKSIFPFAPVLNRKHFPWWFDQLRSGKEIAFRRSKGFPKESSARENRILASLPLSAFLLVPMISGSQVLGIASVVTDDHEDRIDEETSSRARLLSEIFAHAFMRKRNEERRAREAKRDAIVLELYSKSRHMSLEQVYDFALQRSVELTGSTIGYLHRVNEDQSTVALTAWNQSALSECRAYYDTHYSLDQAGIWADCFRTRTPGVHNAYAMESARKGLPEGHVPIVRHLSVPVLEDGKVRLILGIGNKERDYTEADARDLQMIANEIQKVVVRKTYDAELIASLGEKEILLRELYHRTKNNMNVVKSLLELQSMEIREERIRQMLKDTQNRIQAMALVHEKLYGSKNLSQVDVSDYVTSLVDVLMTSFGRLRGRITPKVNVEHVLASIDVLHPLGLLLTELITNTLKHGFPGDRQGEFSIDLRNSEEQRFHLRYSDDGVPFPESVDFEKPKTLGLQLVHMLAEKQMRGSVALLQTESGKEFSITFSDPLK